MRRPRFRPGVRHWLAFAAASSTTAAAMSLRSQYRSEIAEARKRVAAGGRIVETPAGPMQYAESGTGPPVLMIHGAGGGYDQGLFGFREEGFRVIAPSRFGYLGTPLPGDGSPAAQADAFAALLDVLGIERVAVVGASAGALSAMQFAIRHPKRTTALVLQIPDSWAPPEQRRAEKLMANPFIVNVVLKSDFAMWLFMKLARSEMVTFLGVPKPLQATMTAEQNARVDELMHNILPVSRRQAGIMNDAINSKALERYPLERIEAPTLVIDAVDVSTWPGSKYTADHIANAIFVSYPSGGHLLIGHEEESRSAIRDFLREHLRRAMPEMRAALPM